MSDKEPVLVITCTEEDMRAGGLGPLPTDPKAIHKATDEERVQLVAMFQAFDALRKLGWREAMYAPRDGTTFLSIARANMDDRMDRLAMMGDAIVPRVAELIGRAINASNEVLGER